MRQMPHDVASSCEQDRAGEEDTMASKAAVSLTTGLEDPERVTVAFRRRRRCRTGRQTLMFPTKEAARLTIDGVAQAVACGMPPLPELTKRFEAAGGSTSYVRSASTPDTSRRATGRKRLPSVGPSSSGSGSEMSPLLRSATD
jgi:hypothetical protein